MITAAKPNTQPLSPVLTALAPGMSRPRNHPKGPAQKPRNMIFRMDSFIAKRGRQRRARTVLPNGLSVPQPAHSHRLRLRSQDVQLIDGLFDPVCCNEVLPQLEQDDTADNCPQRTHARTKVGWTTPLGNRVVADVSRKCPAGLSSALRENEPIVSTLWPVSMTQRSRSSTHSRQRSSSFCRLAPM